MPSSTCSYSSPSDSASESSGAAGWGLPAGIVAALAVTAIFYLRHRMEETHGKAATAQAAWFGFEAEDVLYLLPLVTALEGLVPFLIAAAIGAPIAAVLVGRQYIQQFRGAAR